jgi:transmembrane sensor
MTNVKQFTNKAEIKQQAGEWLIKIDQGKLSEFEEIQFQEWISLSSFHKQYMEKLAKNWDSMTIMQELGELFPLDSFNASLGAKENAANKPILTLTNSLAFCSVFFICTFIFLFMPNETTLPPQYFATDIGQQANFNLSDGTTLTLNTNTKVEVDFSGDLRKIKLMKGEANFDVAKNPKRPFVVYAGDGVVWAVGTSFNVKYALDKIDVVVSEGVVKVFSYVQDSMQLPKLSHIDNATATEAKMELEAIVTAGQKVSYREKIIESKELESELMEQDLAWQSGVLLFNDDTLEQALVEIGRYTDKQLVITDQSIKDLMIGGRFKTNDVLSLLESFSVVFDIKVTQYDDKILLSKKESSL